MEGPLEGGFAGAKKAGDGLRGLLVDPVDRKK